MGISDTAAHRKVQSHHDRRKMHRRLGLSHPGRLVGKKQLLRGILDEDPSHYSRKDCIVMLTQAHLLSTREMENFLGVRASLAGLSHADQRGTCPASFTSAAGAAKSCRFKTLDESFQNGMS
jgi:hypothetical protein